MNEKFKLLNESLKAIKKSSLNLLALKGEAGTGKSRTTINYLKDEKVNFEYFSGYTTYLYFYRLVYENREKDVLVFDDIEGITDLKIIAMLKSLCWNPEGKEREVCYFSSSDKMEDYGLPSRFKTKARIILIFNNDLRGFEAVINRGLCLDFNFNFQEKLQIFKDMKEKAEIDQEVLNYINLNCNESTENLSIRSLVILSRLKKDGFDFKLFAKEILKSDDETGILLSLVAKSQKSQVSEQVKEWVERTGKSRASYFRAKKRLNL